MEKNSVTKMFEETFSTHFKHATLYTKNSHFGFVLGYILEVAKSINIGKELIIFCCEWQRIETVIGELYGPNQYDLHEKIEEINNHISLLLPTFKKQQAKLFNQKGFQTFYEKEYKALFQESLMLKKNDEKSRIIPKRKRSPDWNSFRIRIYFSIV